MWQHPDEFEAFLEFMRVNNVRSVLEIGTGLGGSAYCFGEITGHGKIVTVDFEMQGAAKIPAAKRRTQPNPNFVQIVGDSRAEATERLINAYAPFDMVYFDTEHAESDVRDNYARYAKMATRFVAQHDINMDEVEWPDAGIPRVWREVRDQGWDSANPRYTSYVEFVKPSPDKRFPRWGGIGVVVL